MNIENKMLHKPNNSTQSENGSSVKNIKDNCQEIIFHTIELSIRICTHCSYNVCTWIWKIIWQSYGKYLSQLVVNITEIIKLELKVFLQFSLSFFLFYSWKPLVMFTLLRLPWDCSIEHSQGHIRLHSFYTMTIWDKYVESSIGQKA